MDRGENTIVVTEGGENQVFSSFETGNALCAHLHDYRFNVRACACACVCSTSCRFFSPPRRHGDMATSGQCVFLYYFFTRGGKKTLDLKRTAARAQQYLQRKRARIRIIGTCN